MCPSSKILHTIKFDAGEQARYATSHSETSGLSSKLKAKPAGLQPLYSDDPNEKKYPFYLDVTIPDKIEVPKTDVIISETMKVSEAVDLALIKFKLELEALGIVVDTNKDLYNPRLPKRNGKAKTDMPCRDSLTQHSIRTRFCRRSRSPG